MPGLGALPTAVSLINMALGISKLIKGIEPGPSLKSIYDRQKLILNDLAALKEAIKWSEEVSAISSSTEFISNRFSSLKEHTTGAKRPLTDHWSTEVLEHVGDHMKTISNSIQGKLQLVSENLVGNFKALLITEMRAAQTTVTQSPRAVVLLFADSMFGDLEKGIACLAYAYKHKNPKADQASVKTKVNIYCDMATEWNTYLKKIDILGGLSHWYQNDHPDTNSYAYFPGEYIDTAPIYASTGYIVIGAKIWLPPAGKAGSDNQGYLWLKQAKLETNGSVDTSSAGWCTWKENVLPKTPDPHPDYFTFRYNPVVDTSMVTVPSGYVVTGMSLWSMYDDQGSAAATCIGGKDSGYMNIHRLAIKVYGKPLNSDGTLGSGAWYSGS